MMEKNMETIIMSSASGLVFRGNIGIMEKKMDTTIGFRVKSVGPRA